MTFSNRLANLGTETAFSVSQDCTEFESKGNIVYPFHLGDIDLRTPNNIIDATIRAIRDGKTGYNPATGILKLRAVLADIAGSERNIEINVDNIVIQPGGKPVITKFIQALMNPGDGVLYPNPGYPIYESQIEFHGGNALPYGYIQTNEGFKIDKDSIKASVGKNMRLLIYNNYQNPTGSESAIEEMEWIAEFSKKHDLWVLSDEAYYNIRYSGSPASITSFPGMLERTVILFTFSKTYAMTGWRLGAAIGPAQLMQIFTKLAVNDESCTNHFIQYGAIEALTGDQTGAKNILYHLKKRRDALARHLHDIPGVSFYMPDSTFYIFPEITNIYNSLQSNSYEDFRIKILKETGVSFCTREHFGTPLVGEKKKYIRFAFSGISTERINEGMGKLKNFLSISGTTVPV